MHMCCTRPFCPSVCALCEQMLVYDIVVHYRTDPRERIGFDLTYEKCTQQSYKTWGGGGGQPLDSPNAATTPQGTPAAAAHRAQRPDATCGGTERVTVQGPVKKPQPDGMSHGGSGGGPRSGGWVSSKIPPRPSYERGLHRRRRCCGGRAGPPTAEWSLRLRMHPIRSPLPKPPKGQAFVVVPLLQDRRCPRIETRPRSHEVTDWRGGVSPAAQMGCLRIRSGSPSGADQP